MMGIDGSYTQTIKTESTLSSSTIHKQMMLKNSYVLSSGSSQIGTFDSKSTIAGSLTSLNERKWFGNINNHQGLL